MVDPQEIAERIKQVIQAVADASEDTPPEREPEVDEKDTIDFVLEKFHQVRGECELWHSYIERCRKLYLLWHHEDDEDTYSVTISKPHNIITYAKSVLLTANFMPDAVAFVDTEDAEQRKSTYEKFALALWTTSEDRNPWPVREMFITNLLVDGSAWMQVYLDPSHCPPSPLVTQWPDNPITLEVVDTLQVYPCLSQNPRKPFEFIITRHEESVADLRANWPDKDWNKYLSPYEDPSEVMVEVYNFSGYDDEGYVVQIICTDRFLLAKDRLWHSSDYPHLPWVVASCYSGLPPLSNDAKRVGLIARFQSLLHPIDDDVTTIEHILAADLRALDLYGNMPPVVKTQAGRPVNVDPDWGNVITLQLGEEIGFPQWPGNPPDSTRLTAFLLGDIQEASFSAAAMGYAGSSASGYQVAITAETSRTRLYLPAKSIARAIKMAATHALQFLKTYLPNTMIHVYGLGPDGRHVALGFHPAMADGLHLECTVRLTMPGDELKKTAMAQQWLAMGIPLEVVLSDVLDFKQPDDIIRKAKIEKAKSHPLVMLLELAEALRQTGSPYLPIILEAIQRVVTNQFKSAAAATPPPSPFSRFAPPGQQPAPPGIGQEVAPLGMTGAPPEFNPLEGGPVPPI